MMFNVGDKVKVECTEVGEVVEDPFESIFSVLVRFGKEYHRFPNDGHLNGMRCIKLVKIEEGLNESFEP